MPIKRKMRKIKRILRALLRSRLNKFSKKCGIMYVLKGTKQLLAPP